MFPFLRNGDEVLLQSPDSKDIRRGAVVVAFTDEIPVVLHRIAKVDGTSITLLYALDHNLFDMDIIEKRRRYEIDKERRPTN